MIKPRKGDRVLIEAVVEGVSNDDLMSLKIANRTTQFISAESIHSILPPDWSTVERGTRVEVSDTDSDWFGAMFVCHVPNVMLPFSAILDTEVRVTDWQRCRLAQEE
jgi:uncharacterized protein YceK